MFNSYLDLQVRPVQVREGLVYIPGGTSPTRLVEFSVRPCYGIDNENYEKNYHYKIIMITMINR